MLAAEGREDWGAESGIQDGGVGQEYSWCGKCLVALKGAWDWGYVCGMWVAMEACLLAIRHGDVGKWN